MEARMKNPAAIVPDVMKSLYALGGAVHKAAHKAGVPEKLLHMIYLRASQINGCGFCVDLHARDLRKMDTEQRAFAVAAWRDTPYFTDAERAALALTEAATRLNDRADAVPDDVWAEAARCYSEEALGVIIMTIATINLWNRVNVPTRQMADPNFSA